MGEHNAKRNGPSFGLFILAAIIVGVTVWALVTL